MNKSIDLNKMSGLLAVKGTAVMPASDATQRVALAKTKESKDEKTESSKADEIVNLSFKVPNEFRKRFKLAAVNADITQNELVQKALIAWEELQLKK